MILGLSYFPNFTSQIKDWRKLKSVIMRKRAFIACLLFLRLGADAQELEQQTVRGNGFSFGMQLSEYQNDFGTGLNITSPFFANRRIAIRVRGNLMYHQHVSGITTTWSPYGNSTVGVVTSSGLVLNVMRVYGEGGTLALFPSGEFSSSDFEMGGYGFFGFEFLVTDQYGSFIEIGGVGIGANADLVPGNPIYSNGLVISAGFRIYP